MVLSMLQMHLQRQEDTGANIWAIILHALLEVCVFQDQSYLNDFSLKLVTPAATATVLPLNQRSCLNRTSIRGVGVEKASVVL